MIEEKCNLQNINGVYTLVTNLEATSQTSLSLLTNLFNPTNNSYMATAYIKSRGVTYASTPN